VKESAQGVPCGPEQDDGVVMTSKLLCERQGGRAPAPGVWCGGGFLRPIRQSEVNGGLAGSSSEIPTTLNCRRAPLRRRASCRASIGDFTAGMGAFNVGG